MPIVIRDNRGRGSKWRDPGTGKWGIGPPGDFEQGVSTFSMTKEEQLRIVERIAVPREVREIEEPPEEEYFDFAFEVEIRDEYFK